MFAHINRGEAERLDSSEKSDLEKMAQRRDMSAEEAAAEGRATRQGLVDNRLVDLKVRGVKLALFVRLWELPDVARRGFEVALSSWEDRWGAALEVSPPPFFPCLFSGL